jgi:hypothetical protein
MKNGFFSLKNQRNIICYPKKMIPIALVRARITSLRSCSWLFVLGQGLGMESAFLTARLRTSRVRGDLMVKPIESITRDVIRDFMLNKVLPAIRAKWPREDLCKPIYIQQDNAPTHIKLDDPIFCEAAKQNGFDIRLISQPPNSPDFNILDLGFFRAIQAIQYKKNSKTIEALVPIVQEVNSSIAFILTFLI